MRSTPLASLWLAEELLEVVKGCEAKGDQHKHQQEFGLFVWLLELVGLVNIDDLEHNIEHMEDKPGKYRVLAVALPVVHHCSPSGEL